MGTYETLTFPSKFIYVSKISEDRINTMKNKPQV